MPANSKQYFGRQFHERRTKEARGDKGLLLENFVSLTMKAGATHFDDLMEIGCSSHKPFPIKHLNERLRALQFPRSKVYFGHLVSMIKQILRNYPELRWWMEADGLVVDEVPPELDSLSRFDRVAGRLMVEHWTNGKLSASSLGLIAATLDAEGFRLHEDLQRAQWKPIADHNKKVKNSAIKTFGAAVSNPSFVRFIRRRLYVSRQRYQSACDRVLS